MVQLQSAIATVRDDVIANRAKRLSNPTRGAGDNYIGGRPTSHTDLAQAIHAMWILREVVRPELLPCVAVAARSAADHSSAP
ncbi:hypothetical protein L0Z42_11090 [Burkholderia multivorans]|nr:hypothetical protein [Burkholderia multivorans]MCO1371096.1 hypothetical protein [Burkholderia multivorans]MCO1457647.1 hypothetical protein [Burkholderia multivorans]MCO1466640.1 hypothetical protein [Burkholderia multivorans]MDN7941658.1 hypothetical protein [Burkholderia multivorans]UQO15691.1 hypothetical protein L0Z02_08590 [Burkholderia multivorans]